MPQLGPSPSEGRASTSKLASQPLPAEITRRTQRRARARTGRCHHGIEATSARPAPADNIKPQ